MLEAVVSSLTEMFAPAIHEDRIAGLLKHYAFADDNALSYFRQRLKEAPQEVEFGLSYVSTLAGADVRPWRLSAMLPRPIRFAANRHTATLWTIALSSRPLLRSAIAEDIDLDAA